MWLSKRDFDSGSTDRNDIEVGVQYLLVAQCSVRTMSSLSPKPIDTTKHLLSTSFILLRLADQ